MLATKQIAPCHSKCENCQSKCDGDLGGTWYPKTTYSRPSLQKALDYKNLEVIERYKDKLDLTHEEALQLFEDVKKFLYICATQQGNFSPTLMIDEGWHEFMMYSRDYREFCTSKFGKIIDHLPRSYLDSSTHTSGQAKNTALIAAQMFGSLSKNWKMTTKQDNCADCGGGGGNCDADYKDPCTACGNDCCTWQKEAVRA